MRTPVRPRRSVLYMPGSKERALVKSRTLAADALILDLEDAVAPGEKETARDLVETAVKAGDFGSREVVIRINGLETEWGAADLTMAARSGADAVLIPKVESAEMVRAIESSLQAYGSPESLKIWAMMETPLGMLRASEIASASDRLTCFVMGTNDLVKDLGAAHTEARLPVITALGLCVLAARAHGLVVLDGVYNAFKDEQGLRASCVQGKEMGFDGKTLIHPAQLAVTNEVYGPSEDEIALADRYVQAFAEAQAAGQGVAVVDGRIVENLHVETAEALLETARAIQVLEKEFAS